MKFSALFISIFFALNAFSQFGPVSNACNSAPILCDGDLFPLSTGLSPVPTVTDTNTISNPGSNPNPIPGNSGCLLSGEYNPNWYILDIESSGSLAFYFTTPGGGSSGFFDWSLWPYDSNACSMIAADSLAPVACNWNGTSAGLTGMADSTNLPLNGNVVNFETPINVVAGEQYIICLNNTSSQVGNMLFTSTGTAGLCQSSADVSEMELNPERKLIKIVDLTGRVVKEQPNMVLLYMYSDGSSERVFKTE